MQYLNFIHLIMYLISTVCTGTVQIKRQKNATIVTYFAKRHKIGIYFGPMLQIIP
jgi:hypothetical protein